MIARFFFNEFHGFRSSLKHVQPSIITVPGDLFNECIPGSGFVIQRYKRVLPLLHACSEIAPTYISLGNHDRYLLEFDIEIMKSLGCCTILDNTWTVFNGIVIGGLSSAWVTNYRKCREQVQSNELYPKVDEGYPRIPDTSWMDGFIAEKGYHILLCHHPEYYSLLPDVDLIISGHAHGGQWNIFGRGLYSSNQGLWPKYFASIYHNKMVVSRGLINTHRRIPRFGNPTEIVYVKPVK